MASIILASGISFAPASIMMTFVEVDATVSCRSPSSHCFWDGLMMNSPSIMPTWVIAQGPSNGISEMQVAMELPSMATSSGRHSGSTDMTRLFRVTSLRKSFGKSGRIGRSMTRAVRTEFSLALPSLLLKPPGIFPTA